MGWRGIALCALVGCDGVLGLHATKLADGYSHVCPTGTPFGAGSAVSIDPAWSVEAARFDTNQTLAYLALCDASACKQQCGLYSSQLLGGKLEALNQLGVSSNVTGYVSYPSVTPSGTYLVYSIDVSKTLGQTSPRVFVSTAQHGAFVNASAQPLDVGATYASDNANEPYVVDDKTLYLSFDVGGNVDLFRMAGDPASFGSSPVAVPGVNAPTTDEFAPVPRSDELEIFFASNRDRGAFNLDIYTATRATTSDAFGPASRVAALSSQDVNWPVWLSPDGCALYYINKVMGSQSCVGTLYVASR